MNNKIDITFTLFKLFTLAFFISAPLVTIQGCAKEAAKIESVSKMESKSEVNEAKSDGEKKSEKVEEIKSETKIELVKTDLPKP